MTPSRAAETRSSAGRRWALRDVLLAAQIALCCVTVTAAFVSLRGLGKALTMNMGFNPQACRADEIRTQPGWLFERSCRPFPAPAAGKGLAAPGSDSGRLRATPRPSRWITSTSDVFSQQTTDFRPSNRAFGAYDYHVSPGYFAAAGTPLLAGRDVSFTDTAKTPPVAVVNQEFARRLFHSDDAVGRYFKNSSGQPIQIVGIVADGKYFRSLKIRKRRRSIPISQNPTHSRHRSSSASPTADAAENGGHHSQSDPRS